MESSCEQDLEFETPTHHEMTARPLSVSPRRRSCKTIFRLNYSTPNFRHFDLYKNCHLPNLSQREGLESRVLKFTLEKMFTRSAPEQRSWKSAV